MEAAGAIYECKARGAFRKHGIRPMAGDQVRISIPENQSCSIEEILPRKNALIRPPVANMDQIFIVASVCHPLPNPLVIDKMIAVAEDKGIEPIVVLSKADLGDWSPWQALYEAAGIRFVAVSAVTGQGVAEDSRAASGEAVYRQFRGGKIDAPQWLGGRLRSGNRRNQPEAGPRPAHHPAGGAAQTERRRLCGGYPWVFHCGYRTV